ncbi:uncharacterized protein LOC124807453 isoform X1 [Hydra vulgaris]|uniref:uncharacterized protein LOC124807453 isoform X1 n=1 Tax=Hydra vulgaris TaxID=6087 RepID=UPI001F5F57FD|nr:uncharacterized protein LOC124807453 isoform X1 [Hydra vulgaris]
MSSDEALALILDCNLTKASYQLMKNKADEKECNLYPAYNNVRMAKDRCYPKNICVTDYTASAPLQDLLDHTTTRLLETQTGVVNANDYNRVTLIYKAGFDGSSGHSIYQQTCNDNECTRNLKSEESLFITCFVPLELSSIVNDKKIILWRNSKPSSTLYCRPLRFKFVEETADLLHSEELTLKNEIKQLTKTSYILLNGKPIDVDNEI